MKIKQTYVLVMTVCALSASSEVTAQTKWRYSYDSAGNRIARIVTSSTFARATDETHQNLFSDRDISATMNENHNQLKIEYHKSVKFNVTIYDLSGRELLSCTADSQIQQIDISMMRRGLYILKVETDGISRSCKFRK